MDLLLVPPRPWSRIKVDEEYAANLEGGIAWSDPALAINWGKSWSRKSVQDDKWSFCLTAGTLWPANQERQ
jgi:dTDP-4-dehydrorhamnose 3,5-epimerase